MLIDQIVISALICLTFILFIQGKWRYDKKHGRGIMTYTNGNYYKGKWKNDMRIQGKVWGKTQDIFKNSNFELHRIEARKGSFCSKHQHKHKYNAFFISVR